MFNKKEIIDFYEEEGRRCRQDPLYLTVKHAKKRWQTIQGLLNPIIKNAKVLDVGCFNGFLSEQLISMGAHFVFAIDVAGSKIFSCKPHHKIIYAKMDWDDMMFPSRTFDVVLLSECLEHAISPRILLLNCVDFGRNVVGTIPLNERKQENPLTKRGNGHLHTFTKESCLDMVKNFNLISSIVDETHFYFHINNE